jgi:hypothetical protein
MGFSVLLSRPEHLQFDKIAQVLSRRDGSPLLDARRGAKRCWGFLGEKLEEPRARLLVAAATEAGLGTLLLEDSEVPPYPVPENMRSGRAAEDGLRFTVGSAAEERLLPWPELKLVCAAGLTERISVRKTVKEGPSGGEQLARVGVTLLTGIPLGLGKSKEVQKTSKEQELFLHMDLAFRGKEAMAFHINPEGFNFTGLGGRKQPNALGNFRLLLQDVARFAPAALKSRGAAGILAGQPFNAHGYDSADDYEKERRWLFALAMRA